MASKATAQGGVSTLAAYDRFVSQCREVFQRKTGDYGTAWRVLRTTSLTDQLYIKAKRIRTIESKGSHVVDEGVEPEYVGLVNYSVMALIQLDLGSDDQAEMLAAEACERYDAKIENARQLMLLKNSDYGEAWRDMRLSSMTDLIIMKLFRIRQIEDNDGQTDVSEGLDANYLDIINYALFALIKLNKL